MTSKSKASSSVSESVKKSSADGVITPETVLKFTKPCETFLCPLTTRKYVQFLEFRIRDLDTNQLFFDVQRPASETDWDNSEDVEIGDEVRKIHYNFGPDFLKAKSIGTTLVFAVGPQEIQNFRMIERHYFKDKLLKSFDFDFGFCIPKSVNTWESIYEVPPLDKKLMKEMIASPGATTSDSFYFVNGKLVMHSKATYAYGP